MITQEQLLQAKTVGVWGYGTTGKSIVAFLLSLNIKPIVCDAKKLDEKELEYFEFHGVNYTQQSNLFLEHCDIIIPSPGIDLRSYIKMFGQKFLSELDLFSFYYRKPVISVVGTLGKTSVSTHIKNALSLAQKSVRLAGNIGVGMLDFISSQDDIDYLVLELSSFQLEYCYNFKSDYVVWTNFFPNHLDRHGTMDLYLEAKKKAIRHTNTHLILVNKELHSLIKKPITTVSDEIKLPVSGIQENWRLVSALLSTLSFKIDVTNSLLSQLNELQNKLEHRMELIATFNNIRIYNDSKATVPEATLAALKKFNHSSTILIIGGLSKGVNRQEFIKNIAHIKKIICFGKEAEQLYKWANDNDSNVAHCATLDETCDVALKVACAEDVILFSPAGSSFDLYKNYEERGRVFKECMLKNLNSLKS